MDLVAGMGRDAFFKAAEILCKCEDIDGVILLGFGFNDAMAKVIGSHPDEDEMDFSEFVKDALYSDIRGMNFIRVFPVSVLNSITGHMLG